MQFKFIKRGSKKLLTKDVLQILDLIENDATYNFKFNGIDTKFKRKHVPFDGFSDGKTIIKIGGACKTIRKFHLADKYYPLNAVPTVVVKFKQKRLFARIQPVAKRDFRRINKIITRMSALSGKEIHKQYGDDAHGDNLGILNNKPVVFDW
jgi:hypothetical protein